MADSVIGTGKALLNTAQLAAKTGENAARAAADITESTGQAANAALKATATGINVANTGLQVTSDVTAASGKTAVAAIDTVNDTTKALQQTLNKANDVKNIIFDHTSDTLKDVGKTKQIASNFANTTLADTAGTVSSFLKSVTTIINVPFEGITNKINDIKAKRELPSTKFGLIKTEIMKNFDITFKNFKTDCNAQIDNLIKQFDDMITMYKQFGCTYTKNLLGKSEDCSNIQSQVIKIGQSKILVNGIKTATMRKINFLDLQFKNKASLINILNVTADNFDSSVSDMQSRFEVLQNEIIQSALSILNASTLDINKKIETLQKQIDDLYNETGSQPTPVSTEGGRRRRKSKRSKRSKRSTKKAKRTRTRKY